MQSLREFLPFGFLQRMEKELGRETTLRLLWPAVVGARLADNTQLKAIRGHRLIVSVPDRSWLAISELNESILGAANRICGDNRYDSIELVITFAAPPQPIPAATPTVRLSSENRRFPASGLEAGMIADDKVRKLFSDSASKYFVAQEERRR